jgi:hypothetical protein
MTATKEWQPPRYAAPRFTLPTVGPLVVRAFYQIAQEERTSLKEIAAKSGVSWESLMHWKVPDGRARRRRRCSLENFEAALNVLGYKLAIVPESYPGVRVSYVSPDLTP